MDFYHNGVSTLHDLRAEPLGHAQTLVEKHAATARAALVLPMLYEEIERPALLGIRQGLMKAKFLNEVVVSLTAKDESQVRRVQEFFRGLPMRTTVVWCEGPEVREALARLADRGFDLRAFSGKGLAVWLGLGAATEDNGAVVLHDADVEDYDPRILYRLLAPVVVPEVDFFFAKGYYARLTGERMYGRTTRLFLWPFLDALGVALKDASPLLRYLRSFRYPLSGEMAMTADLARNVRVPTDWGLELGLLGEVYRNASPKRICQVDLGRYSHKHSPVGAQPTEGLQRQALDVATTVLRQLAAFEGVRITPDLLTTLRVAYRREAQDAIRRYHADSLLNGLGYDRHGEEVVAETFEPIITRAGEQFMREPSRDQIGEWLRAVSADPESPARVRGGPSAATARRILVPEPRRAS